MTKHNIDMKNFTSILFTLLLATLSVAAQNTETRNLSSFEGISVSAGVNATLIKGDQNKIEISASGIELDRINTKISGDVLKVGVDQKWWKNIMNSSKRKVKVVITYNSSLHYIGTSSGARLYADHDIHADDLSIESSSGSNIDLSIEADELRVDLSSGSNISLEGNARVIAVDISSGANLNAYDLVGQDVKVDCTVKYKGNPSETAIDKSSGGNVKKA